MTVQIIRILRALPGAGKSRLAADLSSLGGGELPVKVVSADHFFETFKEGGLNEYNFNPAKLGQAHANCLSKFVDFTSRGYDLIVDNTNSQLWEFENYIDVARAINPNVRVEIHEIITPDIEAVRVFAARNTHGVPVSVILNMWHRWEACPSLSGGPVSVVRHDPYLGG